MRSWLLLLLPLLVPAISSCQSASRLPAGVEPGPPGAPMIGAATQELARNGSFEAEALLTAAGPEVAPEVATLLSSDNPDVRRRATIVLLAVGQDVPLSVGQQVDLALFEITRADGQPWSRLNGLLRIDDLGERAWPELERAVTEGGNRAAMAQRLLSLQQEEP